MTEKSHFNKEVTQDEKHQHQKKKSFSSNDIFNILSTQEYWNLEEIDDKGLYTSA